MGPTFRPVLLIVAVAVFSAQSLGQGETTSAILGQVSDVTGGGSRCNGDDHEPRYWHEAQRQK
jgi:hypothetical protein